MRKIYYFFKPIIPRSIQIFFRRQLIKAKIKKYADVWPILKSSSKKPLNWKGWPDGKSFAFVLTHDVEHSKGVSKCLKLLNLEKELGFVSSFNFVPERYQLEPKLRDLITENGFEVGVHGLNHDGKLFQSRSLFMERARKINAYIYDWKAVGFRAPAMHHNLDWIRELDIEYDLSTFDTDPFEPQSDGVNTIFPFLVNGNESNRGYIEMPYTLVQDFTLFILMKKRDIEIWSRKLDWVAENGGMALINVHPDYINFENKHALEEFPVKFYVELLEYVRNRYEGQYWNALPKDVARIVRSNYSL